MRQRIIAAVIAALAATALWVGVATANTAGPASAWGTQTVRVTTDPSGRADIFFNSAHSAVLNAAPTFVSVIGRSPEGGSNMPVNIVVIAASQSEIRVRILNQSGQPLPFNTLVTLSYKATTDIASCNVNECS